MFSHRQKAPKELEVSFPENLSRDLENLLNDERTHDLKLTFPKESNKQLFCHKAILAARSKEFRKLLSGFKEKQYEIVNFSFDTMYSVVQYIYSGTTIINDHNIIDIVFSSDYYQLDFLKNECFDFLVKLSDKTDICNMIYKADNGIYRFECKQLISKCIAFIEINTVDVLSSEAFLTFSEKVILEILASSSLTISI
jgi:hypothetical protein